MNKKIIQMTTTKRDPALLTAAKWLMFLGSVSMLCSFGINGTGLSPYPALIFGIAMTLVGLVLLYFWRPDESFELQQNEDQPIYISPEDLERHTRSIGTGNIRRNDSIGAKQR